MISKSTIKGNEFSIPEIQDDQKQIDAFLEKNSQKKVVVIQGLGFVGSVMALIVANAYKENYAVIGVDLPTKNGFWKIKSLNEGNFPVVSTDEKIKSYYDGAMHKGNFMATYDAYSYSKADIIIVDINLDVKKRSFFNKDQFNYEVNLNPFEKAIKSIGERCKEDVLVLIETTVPPGTCEKVAKPIFDKCLQDRGLSIHKYKLGHSYERVTPGANYIDSILNFYRVYAGINETSAKATEDFLQTIINTDEYPLTRLNSITASEMAKVLENSYRAINIAFVSEWAQFAEEAGVNLGEIVNAIRMRPTHRNLMLPGLGVGGYCLPKDPLLASWARTHFFGGKEKLAQSENGVFVNDHMPLNAVNLLKKYYKKSLDKSRVLLLGLSYLNDIGDTRNTPVELLYDALFGEGANIIVYDPYIEYWEEKNLIISQSLNAALKLPIDIIIFCTPHNVFKNNKEIISFITSKPKLFVLDTIGILTEEQIQDIKNNCVVKVVGRGDL